ncbi:hypothetical protein KIPB_002815 [Kipferlia bialata]|uniref:Lipid-binding serum glycoprotein C-terminal domain-containing protein n=1 Tax=Kipferlia bialata TaxID=797122 RepID=A0A9K3CRJ4_9EUKA|nr:hypothetical protein KIPB_002815 [Kipferlia bialata]|eukprot:g2815.t1
MGRTGMVGRESIMPSPLPNLVTDEDLQMVISSTVFESLYLSALDLDLLEGEIDYDKVTNPQFQSLLNTATLGSICPGLYAAYPDAPVSLSLETSIMPTVSVMPSALFTNITGTVHVSVLDADTDAMVDAFSVGYSAGLAGIPQTQTHEHTHNHYTSNVTLFYMDYSPYNVTGWPVESSFGPVDMDSPMATQLEMFLSAFGVAPWLSQWTLDHAPNYGIKGDMFDWPAMYPLLLAPATIVYNVPMVVQ